MTSVGRLHLQHERVRAAHVVVSLVLHVHRNGLLRRGRLHSQPDPTPAETALTDLEPETESSGPPAERRRSRGHTRIE